jgi:hypothetical protein
LQGGKDLLTLIKDKGLLSTLFLKNEIGIFFLDEIYMFCYMGRNLFPSENQFRCTTKTKEKKYIIYLPLELHSLTICLHK